MVQQLDSSPIRLPGHDRLREASPTGCLVGPASGAKAGPPGGIHRTKWWRLRVMRSGANLRVPVAQLRRDVKALRNAGWTVTAIAAEVGVSQQSLSWSLTKAEMVSRDTAERVAALRESLRERRWPTAPLKQAIVTRVGPLKATLTVNEMRSIHRAETWPTHKVDEVCIRLGLMPQDVYGDAWWGDQLEEAG